MSNKTAVVIGAGFAGLSAAICLAKEGHIVTLVERHEQTGGRARMLEEKGFRFDMGPSWYWMPEVADNFFSRCGKSLKNYLNLERLDPSYQVIFSDKEKVDIPASFEALQHLFESMEKGAGKQLQRFLKEAGYKYRTAMGAYVNQPGISISEFCNKEVLRSIFKMDMLRSFSSHARKYFKNERLLQIIEFPVLFLGATPQRIPALYSMMNYADMSLGTWYPMGGMHELSKAFTELAKEFGVEISLGTKVEKLLLSGNTVIGVKTDKGILEADVVVSGADYHHTDQELLPYGSSNYSKNYWEKREMAPSCLLYYIGVAKKLDALKHHNLFFEHNFRDHASAIYETKSWPKEPLFYVCCPSRTDSSVAPEGMENLFVLIPTAPGLADTPSERAYYFQFVLDKIERFCGKSIRSDIVYNKSYAYTDFVTDYNAFKGNAYGLANTLRQTAFLKPSIRHKKIPNLFFTGQLTVPGPGVPPAILSGQIVADYIMNHKISIDESAI